jgi:hypothetical protein
MVTLGGPNLQFHEKILKHLHHMSNILFRLRVSSSMLYFTMLSVSQIVERQMVG